MSAQKYVYNDVHYRKTKQNKINAHQKASCSSFFFKGWIRPICRGWIRPIELSPVLLSLNKTEQFIQYDHKYKNNMLLSVYKFIGWRPSGL